MVWIEKEQPTVFDELPIYGLLFLDGDLVADALEPEFPTSDDWERGKKYPLIMFPHAEASLTEGKNGEVLVCIHRQMRLPYFSDRESAYHTALQLAEAQQQVYRQSENRLELWLDSPSESIVIVYDNQQQRMVDIEFVSHDKTEFPTPGNISHPNKAKQAAYLNLVRATEEQSFIRTENGQIIRGILGAFVRTRMEAQAYGLTPSEIRAAIQIGESRNPTKTNPPPGIADDAPYNTEAYWEQVYAEAEQFWLRRYRGEEE